MRSQGVTEFGGWPRPPRWVWVVAGVAAVAVLAGVAVTRAGPRHAVHSSSASAIALGRSGGAPDGGSAAFWPPAPGACGSTGLGVAFSPNGKLMASNSGTGTVRLWNAGTGRPVGKPLQASTQYDAHGVAFSPNGKLMASNSGDGTVRLWNPVWAVAFSPSGKLLASGCGDGTVRIYHGSR